MDSAKRRDGRSCERNLREPPLPKGPAFFSTEYEAYTGQNEWNTLSISRDTATLKAGVRRKEQRAATKGEQAANRSSADASMASATRAKAGAPLPLSSSPIRGRQSSHFSLTPATAQTKLTRRLLPGPTLQCSLSDPDWNSAKSTTTQAASRDDECRTRKKLY